MLFMNEAICEANKALEKGEVPVGAVIVQNNKIISRGHNLKEELKDPTAHAEIIAIRNACRTLNNWRLSNCSMYVTLEPCSMCISAIIDARIKDIYIGTFDPTRGCCGSVINLAQNTYLNNFVNVHWVYEDKCSDILKDFFRQRRL